MTLNVGLLGFAGFGGQDHQSTMYVPALQRNPRARVTVVASVDASDRQAAASAAARWSLPLAADVDALLADPAVDAVVVCAPVARRGEILADIVDRGRHVLADKPLALTAPEIRAVRTAATERPEVVVAVAHHRRLHPTLAPAVAAIAAGRVGLPWNLQADFMVAGGAMVPEGELRNLGLYPVDLTLVILEVPVERVHAFAVGPDTPPSSVLLLLDHANGVTSTITVGRAAPLLGTAPGGIVLDRYRVSGTHGTTTVDLARPALEVRTADRYETTWTGGSTVDALVADWLDAIEQGRPPAAGIAAALAVAEVLDAAERSLASGRPEPVSPPHAPTHDPKDDA